jgi:peptidyl-prolyl cis-trans isomerase C
MNETKTNESKKNMKIKSKVIFSAALAGVLILLPGARAVTGDSTMTTNATSTGAATATNSNPNDVMKALFGDPVIAQGKGVQINQSQLDGEMARIKTSLAGRGQTLSDDDIAGLEAKVLNSLITKQLLLAMATPDDKAKGKADFEKIELQLKTSAKLTDAQFDDRLNEQLKLMNITRADWEKESIDQTTTIAALKRELNINVTDADASDYYSNNIAKFQMPEMVHVRHILLMTIDPTTQTPLTDDQQKAKRKQIEDILKRVRAGEDFATLAKEYSEDPGSKDNGGDLPPFPRGAMVPEFEAAAFSMTNNQISDPITTKYGYHIIQFLGKVPAKTLTLQDTPPDSSVTVMDYIKEKLAEQKMQQTALPYLQTLTKSADVKILDPQLKAAVDAVNSAQSSAPADAPADAPAN